MVTITCYYSFVTLTITVHLDGSVTVRFEPP